MDEGLIAMNSYEKLRKFLLWALVSASAIGLSIDIYNNSPNGDILKGLSNFKFFTLQSNLLVLIYSLISLTWLDIKNKQIFKISLGPVTAYILLTGIVYLVILEPIYELYGLRIVSSSLLHYTTPPLMLAYWYITEERKYKITEFFGWLLYPLLFMGWGLFLALTYNDYLYPFFDTGKYGWGVVYYLILVAIGFSCMILVLIFINNIYMTPGKRARIERERRSKPRGGNFR